MTITDRIRDFPNKKKRPPVFSAVILAAGNSTRMGQDKIELSPGGVPVLVRTVRAFEESELVSEIILVTRWDRVQELADQIHEYDFQKVKTVIAGGSTRAESSLAGVLAADKNAKLIGIHDCARPFVSQRVIRDTACAARDFYAALPVVPVTDTVKVKNGKFLGDLVDRESICAIQTPQIFRADLIKGALTYVVKKGLPVTDDSSAVAYFGIKTRMVEGDRENIKLTTPDDMIFAEAIIKNMGERKDSGMRIGHGYDVHRLTDGRKLILGGVEIPFEMGLLGHSDADVLVHALMDAILGAAALGDIGKLFPDSDDAYLGADSLNLLRRVCSLVSEKGYSLANADCTVIAQCPKLAPYVDMMRKKIAEATGVPVGNISIKATTEEKLGFTGEGLGIAAHAVVLLE